MRFLIAILLLLPFTAQAARERFTQDGVTFSISVRNIEGVTAFYAARGFTKSMLDAIGQTCFVGVGIHNERPDTLLLDLSDWRFGDADGHEVKRITRPEWDKRWEQMQAPYAPRATFDWTQLPESRDLQPGEPVGGNVAIVDPGQEFSLSARFHTGGGKVVEITVPGLRCAGAKP